MHEQDEISQNEIIENEPGHVDPEKSLDNELFQVRERDLNEVRLEMGEQLFAF